MKEGSSVHRVPIDRAHLPNYYTCSTTTPIYYDAYLVPDDRAQRVRHELRDDVREKPRVVELVVALRQVRLTRVAVRAGRAVAGGVGVTAGRVVTRFTVGVVTRVTVGAAGRRDPRRERGREPVLDGGAAH